MHMPSLTQSETLYSVKCHTTHMIRQHKTLLITRSFELPRGRVHYTDSQCYNEIGDLRISTVKTSIMRSRFVTGHLGCSNNSL